MGKNNKSSKGSGDKAEGGKAKAGAQLINVRHILCEKHAKKEEALGKINDGVKFDEVARNYSEDKARAGEFTFVCTKNKFNKIKGGSLGWKAKGDLDPKFEEVAFALEPSSTSSPKIAEVKTEFGYHIIMVEGRK
ncbi:Peptidyl-prolyl cis-trans isomerase-like protein [Emericellopsis cladophorae]|uniref:Peptidyl-prolyl cis-trans isomerase n=1 Tax=Emericellopsis cladophorae TaxID=2686198 RepID=A0A9P9Y2Z9_9HYPO|nr:Peptidyl-prolyl cis-trans isomerase-like protein [Emericellopsis cladophorae]KAI6782145.1 Peptidyl-prolyl cis-trans isomerase-like protein [Emericellopsis cladophorae]